MRSLTQCLAPLWDRLSGRAELELEVRRELWSHVEDSRDAYLAAGEDAVAAMARALVRFGDFEAHVAACVDERITQEHHMGTKASVVITLLFGAVTFLAWTSYLQGERLEKAVLVLEEARLQPERASLTPRPVVFNIGDELEVVDRLNPSDIQVTQAIAEDGMILLPELGWVMAFGKERQAFETELRAAFEKYYERSDIYVRRVSRGGALE